MSDDGDPDFEAGVPRTNQFERCVNANKSFSGIPRCGTGSHSGVDGNALQEIA